MPCWIGKTQRPIFDMSGKQLAALRLFSATLGLSVGLGEADTADWWKLVSRRCRPQSRYRDWVGNSYATAVAAAMAAEPN
jgi:hypothetical protein